MNKMGHVAIVVGLVTIVYLLLLVVIPVVTGIVETANATMTAGSDLTNYPGSAETMIAAPWVLFFVPGAIGIVVIVIILKQP